VSAAREAFVQEAELLLADDTDSAEPGAAVTIALCGYWEHEGPCRWPHNNAITAEHGAAARFRTLFVADGAEEQSVRDLIVGALGDATGWTVTSTATRPVAESEHDLARRLLSTRAAHQL
jgi:hypothetical protein